MDDSHLAVSSSNVATKIFHETLKVLASGGFNLTKWNSNFQEDVLDLLNPLNIRLNSETSAPQISKGSWSTLVSRNRCLYYRAKTVP